MNFLSRQIIFHVRCRWWWFLRSFRRNKGQIFKAIAQAGHRTLRSDSVLVHTGYIGTGAKLIPGFGTQPYPDPFAMPRPWYIAPSIVPLMWCSCPVPLAEKHPQSIMFWPSCLMVGMVFLGSWQHSSSSKHGELSWSQRPGFWSHLTTTPSPSSPLNHWQTSDGPVHAAWFQSFTA